jgi:ChrR-like protein with cupin domain
MLESFNTRLLLSVHGISPARLERSSILTIVQELVREQLRALADLDDDVLTFDEAAEELRVLARMLERRNRPPGRYEKQLAEIEKIKHYRGLTATRTPDVSRAVAVRRESAALRSPGAGIEIRDLWRDGERRALLVKMPPGSKWPDLDYHIPGPEEVYVISGDLNDGPYAHTEGTFIHYPAGSSHAPSTRAGCTLFVFYPEG